MVKPSTKKKRNKITIALLAPILAVVFIAGWILYSIGEPRHQKAKQPQKIINKTLPEQDQVELILIPPQKEELTVN